MIHIATGRRRFFAHIYYSVMYGTMTCDVSRKFLKQSQEQATDISAEDFYDRKALIERKMNSLLAVTIKGINIFSIWFLFSLRREQMGGKITKIRLGVDPDLIHVWGNRRSSLIRRPFSKIILLHNSDCKRSYEASRRHWSYGFCRSYVNSFLDGHDIWCSWVAGFSYRI